MGFQYRSEFYDTEETAMASLSVCECGWQHSGSGFSYGPAVRDYYVIQYIVSGKGVYEIEGKSYPVEAGQGFVIRPGKPTFYRADKENPWHYYWVGFRGTEANRLLSLAGLTQPVFITPPDCPIEQQMENIYLASKRGSRSFAMVGHLYLLFSSMIQETMHKESPAEELVGKAMRYVETHLAERVTVEQLAQEVGVERSTLYRLFEQVLGSSPLAAIRTIKLTFARHLLEDGYPIERVGEAVGYGNPAHFSKVFKQQFDCTPSFWRKNQRNKHESIDK